MSHHVAVPAGEDYRQVGPAILDLFGKFDAADPWHDDVKSASAVLKHVEHGQSKFYTTYLSAGRDTGITVFPSKFLRMNRIWRPNCLY